MCKKEASAASLQQEGLQTPDKQRCQVQGAGEHPRPPPRSPQPRGCRFGGGDGSRAKPVHQVPRSLPAQTFHLLSPSSNPVFDLWTEVALWALQRSFYLVVISSPAAQQCSSIGLSRASSLLCPASCLSLSKSIL